MGFVKVTQKNNCVKVTFQGVPQTENDIPNYLSLLDQIYAEERKFLILYDASNIGRVKFSDIKKQADYMFKRKEVTKKYMVRAAIVMTSTTARAALQVLFKIRKPISPFRVFKTIEEAKKWLICPTPVLPEESSTMKEHSKEEEKSDV